MTPFRWAGNRVLDLLFGRAEEIPPYPPTTEVKCPCDCGLTMGEVRDLP